MIRLIRISLFSETENNEIGIYLKKDLKFIRKSFISKRLVSNENLIKKSNEKLFQFKQSSHTD